ncbi:hypothetical protein J0674_20670 [Vibrio parahaemolyticus]|uniref:hypothetical protein n=1 Tax=Vibrio parahaemolyticus TaxID=670 RepID=UPI001A8CC15A|nr:hypothetical protein [Vibrio parahaemolyticus]MBO0174634.1 hypothetical protein [Vibrio parahaemolyticus]HCG6523281.1 hypothetical protein [Vibrio parahaemolyticus]
MKKFFTIGVAIVAFIPYTSHAFLAWTIVDPAKTGQKASQTATDGMTAAERALTKSQEMANEINNAIKSFQNDDNLKAFHTATVSGSHSETHNLLMQSKMEVTPGLCEFVERAYVANFDEQGCLFFDDDGLTSSLVIEGEKVLPGKLAEETFDKLKSSISHRTPIGAPNLHEEYTILLNDTFGQAELSELSHEDRLAMDQLVGLLTTQNQSTIPHPKDMKGSDDELRLTRKLNRYLRSDLAIATMKSSYIKRSQLSDMNSIQSDIWQGRTEELSDMKSLGMPVETVNGLSPRPTSESVARMDAIQSARLARYLLAYYESLLTREANLALKTQILAELAENGL